MVFLILSGFMIVTAEVSNYYSRKHGTGKGDEGKKEERYDDKRLIAQDRDFNHFIEDSDRGWDK
jgi:hypothetical protein